MARIEDYKSEANRCRAFFCTTYQEHFDNVREQIFVPLEVDSGIYILHDKDFYDDGTPKKPHYHLYLNFGKNSNTTCDYLAKFLKVENIQFNDHIINKPVQAVRKNQKACEDYMMHLGYPGFKYSPSELHYYNCESASSLSDVVEQLERLLAWVNDCKEQHIHLTWTQFAQECVNQGFGKMLIQKTYFFDKTYKDNFENGYNTRKKY